MFIETCNETKWINTEIYTDMCD
eukprot:SAG11_NODE_39147_length_240_cov_3.106383_1_plen_22_part_10